jgi:hypothetical protein
MNPILKQVEKPYFIFVITVLGYGSAYLFQVGVATFYGITIDNVEVGIPNLVGAVVVALGTISFLFLAESMKRTLIAKFKYAKYEEFKRYVSSAVDIELLLLGAVAASVALAYAFPPPDDTNGNPYGILWVLPIIVPAILPLMIVSDILKARHRRQKFYVFLKDREKQLGIRPQSNAEKFWLPVIIGIFIYLPLSLLGGYSYAQGKTDYFSISEAGGRVDLVVVEKGERVIVKTYDIQAKIFTPSYTSLDSNGMHFKKFKILINKR